jgi:hypothetical protein
VLGHAVEEALKTVLLRFCLQDGRIPDKGAWVNAAKHFGEMPTLLPADRF